MIAFKKFLDCLNSHMTTSEGGDEEKLLSVIPDAKIFVFLDQILTKIIHDFHTQIVINDYLSLPFRTCWFEFISEDGLLAGMKGQLGGKAVNTVGWLVHENAPDNYMVSILQVMYESEGEIGKRQVEMMVHTYDNIGPKDGIFAQLQMIDAALRRGDVAFGTENSREALKIKRNGVKTVHRVRKIIHVFPKKNVQKKQGLPLNVDWSHRWLVMGHWRKLPEGRGLGKDREGNYCMKGMTWVSEHQKGPEHLPLIADKVRVIHKKEDE